MDEPFARTGALAPSITKHQLFAENFMAEISCGVERTFIFAADFCRNAAGMCCARRS